MTLITDSFIQSTSIHSMVQEPITWSCLGSGRLLKELGSTIRDMTKPSLADQHIANLKSTSHDLKSILRSACRWEDLDLFKISPVTAISLVLIDTVTCVEKLSEAVNELASLANLKGITEPAEVRILSSQRHQPMLYRGRVQPFSVDDEHHDHKVMVTESPAKSRYP